MIELFYKNYHKNFFLYKYYYIYLLQILLFINNNNIKKYILSESNFRLLFFFKRKRRKKRIFYKINKKIYFKKIKYKSNEKILFLKRKSGVLKQKYNPKAFYLYKMNFYINLKRNKKRKRIKGLLYKLKYKVFNKLFFKKNRKHLFKRTTLNPTKQFKKTKLIKHIYTNKNIHNVKFNTLVHTLLALKLFANFKDAYAYINKLGVYYNGKYVYNTNIVIQKGDVFSLNSDIYFYFYLVCLYKHLRRYFRKVKPRIFKLIRHKIDIHKQATRKYPK